MLRQFFIRDRMVMAGLVILGLATVAAGFVSGRSTFQYALSTDARQASMQWVKRFEDQTIRSQINQPGAASRQNMVVGAPKLLSKYQAQARKTGDHGLSFARYSNEESGLLAGIDKLFSGWITQLTRFLDADNHVSQVKNFALLEPDGTVVLRSVNFDREALDALIASGAFVSELHKALGLYTTRIIDRFSLQGEESDEFHKALIVPLVDGQKISRVYLLELDQSSAATMSKVALIAASMMTSLLIVLGYSVPAAVAFRRIREKWKAEDQIRFLAMHDPLTGLPNRVQLKNRLDQALTRAKRRGSMLTIMCVDLDRFKEVNDTLGHNAGDALLREASDRLRDCVRDTDIVARLGGDEFVVVAEDLDQPSDAIPLAQRICEELGKNFDIEGQEMAISGSVGITTAPAEGADTQTLLNNADLALYRAKSDGRNTFRFFEPEMDQAIQYRRAMANDLRLALRNNELHIDYQPQFDLETGRLTGYEALARWIHKSKGNIPPGEFIPIAEESGLICTLGEWVLETASAYARHWPDETKLSVNISPVQFLTQDLAAMVRDVLAKTGFPPQRLLLEFKENLLFRNTEETIRTLQELTRMGVLLALDDFGTGYSSLSYLTRLPVSKIKIDRSFICQMENDKNISAIVNTIIGLGKSLNVTIAAEGVETEAQARHLRNVGCDEAQGFLFGRPASAIQKERPGEINMPVVLDTELHEIPHKEPAEPASELSQLLPPSPDELKELGRQMREKEEGADAGSSAKVTPLRRDGGELAG